MVKSQKLADWIAFIDIDEFMYRTNHGCLMDYLSTLNDRGALILNWRMMSPSNQIFQLPRDTLLIEASHHVLPADSPELVPRVTEFHHQFCKSIVRVDVTIKCANPHFCQHEDGWPILDELGHVVAHGRNYDAKFPETHMRLHHYRVRTIEDFVLKGFRGDVFYPKARDCSFDSTVARLRMYFTNFTSAQPSFMQPAIRPVRYLLGLTDQLYARGGEEG